MWPPPISALPVCFSCARAGMANITASANTPTRFFIHSSLTDSNYPQPAGAWAADEIPAEVPILPSMPPRGKGPNGSRSKANERVSGGMGTGWHLIAGVAAARLAGAPRRREKQKVWNKANCQLFLLE